MRILVVEDQPLISQALAEALQAVGHEVVGPAVSSMAAALLLARELPQLAFVDIDLEARGIGLHVAHRLHYQCGVPVILTTGQPDLARSCNWAMGLVAKPYDPGELAAAAQIIASIRTGDSPAPAHLPAFIELFAHVVPVQLANFRTKLRPVLLVDDHSSDVEFALAALARCEVANPIIVARDGVEALQYLRSHGDEDTGQRGRPALILLDIKMPRISGLEVLEKIKIDSRLRPIPIVMLTASALESDVQHCNRCGVAGFIVKPRSLDHLVDAIYGLRRFWEPERKPHTPSSH